MKLLTVCSLIGLLALSWRYRELAATKAATEASLVEATKELDKARAELSGQNTPRPKPDWSQKSIRNPNSVPK